MCHFRLQSVDQLAALIHFMTASGRKKRHQKNFDQPFWIRNLMFPSVSSLRYPSRFFIKNILTFFSEKNHQLRGQNRLGHHSISVSNMPVLLQSTIFPRLFRLIVLSCGSWCSSPSVDQMVSVEESSNDARANSRWKICTTQWQQHDHLRPRQLPNWSC